MWIAREACEQDAKPRDDCVENITRKEICDNDNDPHLPQCNIIVTCKWSCPNTRTIRGPCQNFGIENCDDCGKYCDRNTDPPNGARCNGNGKGGVGSCRCSTGRKNKRKPVFFCKNSKTLDEEVE